MGTEVGSDEKNRDGGEKYEDVSMKDKATGERGEERGNGRGTPANSGEIAWHSGTTPGRKISKRWSTGRVYKPQTPIGIEWLEDTTSMGYLQRPLP